MNEDIVYSLLNIPKGRVLKNKFSISTAGIGEAAKRSASALHEAGNSMEQSVALITGANASVQDSSKVGNALKSISLRLRGISEDGSDVSDLVPTLEKKFNSMGMSLKKDENTFKSTYEIFSDIHNVFNSLSGMQKSDLLELVAGKENANVAASLIANWKDAEGALQSGLNSFGSSAKENQRHIESLAGHVAKFQNAANSFWSSNMTSEALKDIVDTGTALIGVLTRLTDTFGGLNLVILTVTASILKFSSAGKSLVGTFSSMIPLMNTVNKNVERLSVATQRASTTNKMLGVSLTGLKMSLLGARVAAAALEATMTLGLSLAITGIISGLTALYNAHQKNKEVQDQVKAQNEQIANNWSTQKDKIQELLVTYDELSKITKQGTLFSGAAEEAKYKDTVQQLADLMPNLVESLNSKGEAHLKSASAIQQEIAFTERLTELNNKQKILDASSNFQDQLDRLKELQKEMDQVRKSAEGGFGGYDSSGFAIRLDESEMNQAKSQLLTLQNEFATISNSVRGDVETLINTILSINQVKITDNVGQEIAKLASNLEISGLSKDELKAKAQAVAAFFTNLNSLKSANSIQAATVLGKNVTALGHEIGLTDAQIQSFIKSLNELPPAQEKPAETSKNLEETLNTLSDKMRDTTSSIDQLGSAYDTLHEGESLSASTLLELIGRYPELASYLTQTNDLTFKKGEILKQVADIERQKLLQEVQNELDSNKILWDSLEAKRKMYKQYYDGIGAFKPGVAFKDQMLSAEDQAFLDQMGGLQAQADVLSKPIDFFFSAGKKAPKEKKPKQPKQEPQLKDALQEQDLTKELISAMNSEFDIRQKNIDALDRKIKLAEAEKDQIATTELTTKKIQEQQAAIEALKTAQQKMHKEADKIRAQKPGVNVESWFDTNGEASQKYKEYINSFAKRSEVVHNNTKLSVAERNKEIEGIKKEQDEVQTMFDHLYLLKSAWKGNSVEIQRVTDDISVLQEQLKQYVIDAAQGVVDAQNKIDQAIADSYQSQIDDLQKQWDIQAENEERSKRQLEISQLQSQLSVIQLGNIANISDEVAKQLGLEKEKADAVQRQNDLIKQQQTLQNVQNEKNVRLFQNGEFQWVADPRKIREEQDKLTQMQDDIAKQRKDELDNLQNDLKSKQEEFSNWERDNSRQHLIESIQDKIKAQEEQINLRNQWFEENKTAIGQNGLDINDIVSSSLDTLNGTYGSKWDSILATLAQKLEAAKQMYSELSSLGSGGVGSDPNEKGAGSSSGGTSSSSGSKSGKSNQQVYLENLQKTGSKGNKQWATEQLKLKKYAEGGLNTETGLAWLDGTASKPELVLKSDDTKNYLNSLKIMEKLNLPDVLSKMKTAANFLTNFHVKTPDFSSLVQRNSSSSSVTGDTIHIDHLEVRTNDAGKLMTNLKNMAKKKN